MSKRSDRRAAQRAREQEDDRGGVLVEALGALATSLANGRRARDAQESLMVGTTEFVDQREWMPVGYGFDTYGAGMISRQDDRRDGRNSPFVETELDSDTVRGMARLVTTVNCPGVGIVENLKNYVVGKGFAFKAARKKRREVPQGLLAVVQDVLDDYLDDNDFLGDLDRELLLRSRRDGEFFLCHYPKPGGRCALRVAEPECIRDPGGLIDREYLASCGVDARRALDFTFGVLTPTEDVCEALGYACQWSSEDNFDFLPARFVVHHKLNVERNIKRGMSDFYPACDWLFRQARLLKNTGEGATELAAIAYIVQFATATSGQVQSMIDGQPGYTMNKPTPGGGYTQQTKTTREPGRLSVPKGQEYLPGPMGADRGQSFLEVVGGILRQVGVRWCMNEGMISGDDSNNNHASMVEAGSRFYNFVDAAQATIGSQYRKSAWIALRIAYDAGRFARFGLEWEEFKRCVEVRITPPAIGKADSEEQERVREIRFDKGVLSKERWQEEIGYDSDEAIDGEAIPRIGPDGEALDAAQSALDVAKQALNGAQVASLLGLLTSGATQQLPLGSIKAMILASFPTLTQDQIDGMVDPLASFIPVPEGAPITRPAGDGGGGLDPNAAASAVAGGGTVADYSDKSRLQFKRNASSILDIVKRLQGGELTQVQAGEMLGMLGMPPDRIKRLLDDASDNGKLDDPALAQMTESLAAELSPWWAAQFGGSVLESYP